MFRFFPINELVALPQIYAFIPGGKSPCHHWVDKELSRVYYRNGDEFHVETHEFQVGANDIELSYCINKKSTHKLSMMTFVDKLKKTGLV